MAEDEQFIDEPYVRAPSTISPERVAELRTRMDTTHQLSAFIVSTFTLYCGACGCEGIRQSSSPFDAAGGFYVDGWRIVNEQPLCASCVKEKNL